MDRKKILLTCITIFLFIIVLILSFLFFKRVTLKQNFENDILSFINKNDNTIFQIDKIVFFSSCDAENKSTSGTNFTIQNLYQFTDIAIFLKSPLIEKNSENILKRVYIDNIKYNKLPLIGEPELYYKNINSFAKSEFIEDNLITNKLEFNITSKDIANLDTPTLYNNLANPIVLSYVNNNIKNNYTFTDISTQITYDGSLLKKCSVLLPDLTCNISFDIYIVNHLDQEFKCTIYLDIPLEIQEQSIYNGNITFTQDSNLTFYRYK